MKERHHLALSLLGAERPEFKTGIIMGAEQSLYSSVLNRSAGPNKHAGWKILENIRCTVQNF